MHMRACVCCTSRGGTDGEGEQRISSRLHTQRGAQRGAVSHNSEIMT